MDDKMVDAFQRIAEAVDREQAARGACLKRATQVLHQIANSENMQGVRDLANKALQEIAVTLTA